MCSYCYFEGNIYDHFEGGRTVSIIKDGRIWGSGFGEPVLGMVLVPVIEIVLETTQVGEVVYRGSGYGKPEDYCVGEII